MLGNTIGVSTCSETRRKKRIKKVFHARATCLESCMWHAAAAAVVVGAYLGCASQVVMSTLLILDIRFFLLLLLLGFLGPHSTHVTRPQQAELNAHFEPRPRLGLLPQIDAAQLDTVAAAVWLRV